MTNPDLVLAGSYNYWLVALSVFIEMLASYAALDLGERVTASHGRVRFLWLAGGSIAMGTGIWSMDYIGMLAYSRPVRMHYDWPMVLLSWLAAVVATTSERKRYQREGGMRRRGSPAVTSTECSSQPLEAEPTCLQVTLCSGRTLRT